MRILWCTVDRSHRVAQQFDIFRAHVKKIADVVEIVKDIAGKGPKMWQASRDLISGKIKPKNLIFDYLNKVDDNFDFIFCDAFFAYMYEDWRHFGIPSGILIEDVHQEVPKAQIKKAKEQGIENIFHRFNFPFHKFHPNARKDFKCFWLPHSVDITKFKPGPKKIDLLHVGVYPQRYYPYRSNAVKNLKDKPYFTQIDRPKEGGDRSSKFPLDTDYANLISSAKACITGGSVFDAPVQKYVEIPACNTLLISNWFIDLGLLGYIPGENMISYSLNNTAKTVEDILKDSYRLSVISEKGYQLTLSKHTSSIRAMQFINYIGQIIRKHLEFPTIKPCAYNVIFNISEVSDRLEKSIKKAKSSICNKFAPNTGWRSRIG